jgi:hypothetical protein
VLPWSLVSRVSSKQAKPIHYRKSGRDVSIYIFKSETRNELHAFADDQRGSRLPEHHGPWTAIGIVGEHKAPPHGISRKTIEDAIDGKGFQLWRKTKKVEADA